MSHVFVSALDGGCAACWSWDGREFATLEAARDQFPDGNNKDCERGEACTCTLVVVGDEARKEPEPDREYVPPPDDWPDDGTLVRIRLTR